MYGKPKTNGFREFMRDLRSRNFSGVILLTGKEEFLIEWAERELVKTFITPSTKVFDYQTLEEDSAMADMIDAMRALPVMSEKRIVRIRNSALVQSPSPKGIPVEEVENMVGELDSIGGSTIVVFSSGSIDGRSKIVKKIKKDGNVYEFDTLDKAELSSFAEKRIRAAGKRISDQMLSYMIRETGYFNKESDYDLFDFDNDIKKVIAVSDDEITADCVTEQIIGDEETFIFDLLDGISGNNKQKSFEILRNRLSRNKYEAMSLAGSIVSQLEIMYIVKEYSVREMANASVIAKKTGQNEWRIGKILDFARRYEIDKIRSMLKRAYGLSSTIVTGEMDSGLALEMFIAEI